MRVMTFGMDDAFVDGMDGAFVDAISFHMQI
jgi:hypothetical protein